MSEAGPSGTKPQYVFGADDPEQGENLCLAILKAMLHFSHETGTVPRADSTFFYHFFSGNGYIDLSKKELARTIENVEKAYKETLVEKDQLQEDFVFDDHFTEEIFELCKMIWSDDEKFNQDSIQESVLIDPISRKPVVKTGEMKGGYNFLPVTDYEKRDWAYLHQDKFDDIALLKAVLFFYHNTGVLPPAHSRELSNFVCQSVFKYRETDFTRPWIVANILRCENDYMYMSHEAGFFMPFECPLVQEIYDLGRRIWGDQNQNDPDGAQNEQDFDALVQKAIEANVFRMSLLLVYHNY